MQSCLRNLSCLFNAAAIVWAVTAVSLYCTSARLSVGSPASKLPNTGSARIYISEVMASNRRTLNDADGDSSDWIEIFNPGSATVRMDGWFLTDDRNRLTKWRFPEVEVPANGFRIVFASDKDRAIPGGSLHTNFKLAAAGEYLALVSPDLIVVSEFSPVLPMQIPDVSYGYVPESPNLGVYFAQPTPGAPNSAAARGFAAEVRFSRVSGIFLDTFEVALSTDTSEARIRYTSDGSLPTELSPVYTAPIHITDSVQIRTRAFTDGLFPGPVRTEAFLRLDKDLASFESNLPILVVHSLGQGAPITRDPFQSARALTFEPVQGVSSFSQPPVSSVRCGIKIRGGVSPKSTYTMELRDELDRDLDYEFLSLPPESDWVLYGPEHSDAVLIHNPFVHELSRELGRYSPRTRFVELFLNTETGPITAASYHGIYVIEEKVKIGRNRIDIDKLQPENLTPPSVTGSYLFKIDVPEEAGEHGFFLYPPTHVVHLDPKEAALESPQRRPQWQYIREFFDHFLGALNGPDWRNPKTGYAAYIDTDSWIDWNIVEMISGNMDSMAKSSYFFKPRNGKITFGPHWDFDLAFGRGGAAARDWSPGLFRGWWERLFLDPDFVQKWIDRYQELRRSSLSIPHTHALIDRLADEVRLAQPRDQQRWDRKLRGRSYQRVVDYMKNYVSNKLTWIERQFVSPPVFSLDGGGVTPGFILRIGGPPSATVYYTLDGTDPRLPHSGEPSEEARAYAGPIQLHSNTIVTARAWNPSQRQFDDPPISSPWSGSVAATFLVNTDANSLPQLMIERGPPVRLSFFAVLGRVYTIEYRDNLVFGSWQPLKSIDLPPVEGFVTVTDSDITNARFYRLESH